MQQTRQKPDAAVGNCLLPDHLRLSLRAQIALEDGKYNPSLKLAFAISRVFDRMSEDIFHRDG